MGQQVPRRDMVPASVSSLASASTMVFIRNELRTEEISDAADNLFYKVRDFLVSNKAPRFRIGYLVAAIIAGIGSAGFFRLITPFLRAAGQFRSDFCSAFFLQQV